MGNVSLNENLNYEGPDRTSLNKETRRVIYGLVVRSGGELDGWWFKTALSAPQQSRIRSAHDSTSSPTRLRSTGVYGRPSIITATLRHVNISVLPTPGLEVDVSLRLCATAPSWTRCRGPWVGVASKAIVSLHKEFIPRL
jgi:hypothetical protein